MDELKSWGLTICFAALACGIASIISPPGKMEKIFKFTISIFFLCCLLYPLFSMKNISLKNLKIEDQVTFQSNKLKENTMEQTSQITSQNMKKIVNQLCLDNGVTPKEINVNVIETENKLLNIESVDIVLCNKDMAKKDIIKLKLKENYGLTAVNIEGEK